MICLKKICIYVCIYTVKGTSLKSSAPKGAVRISLRAKLVRVLPKSARSDRELATLQSTRNEPSTATVRRERPT